MDEKKEMVSFQVHEGDMARMERDNRRLLIALIVALVIFLINNVVWILVGKYFITTYVQPAQVVYETESESD